MPPVVSTASLLRLGALPAAPMKTRRGSSSQSLLVPASKALLCQLWARSCGCCMFRHMSEQQGLGARPRAEPGDRGPCRRDGEVLGTSPQTRGSLYTPLEAENLPSSHSWAVRSRGPAVSVCLGQGVPAGASWRPRRRCGLWAPTAAYPWLLIPPVLLQHRGQGLRGYFDLRPSSVERSGGGPAATDERAVRGRPSAEWAPCVTQRHRHPSLAVMSAPLLHWAAVS